MFSTFFYRALDSMNISRNYIFPKSQLSLRIIKIILLINIDHL